jgi:Zn-dependent peptidase ImmA (M78 family)
MDYSKIKIPYIKNLEIEKQAKNFRQKYYQGELPINIEKIIDISLKIDIIPLPNLEKMCNTDALITSDWQSLYIDKDLFEDERRQNRLRFSLAHEIGHLILHKDLYNIFEINSFEDFYNFIDLMPGEQYGYLETQANKFASYLLVPREIIKERLGRETKKVADIQKFDKTLLKSYLAIPLAREFGISQESMEIILNEFIKD